MIPLYLRTIKLFKFADGIPALLIRLILAPVMIIAGFNKLQFSDAEASFLQQFTASPGIVDWFGNADWGLGLPFPELLANLAAWTEFLGGWLILIGLFTRIISIPLMFTMFVAATTVHLENGWFAIAPSNPDTSPAKVFQWLGVDAANQSLANSGSTGDKLARMRSILEQHGNTDWLYENGSIVVLNNGIEFAATYFVMFLTLFFIGGGRFFSVDYWLAKVYRIEEKSDYEGN